jgi:hypothetical protein
MVHGPAVTGAQPAAVMATIGMGGSADHDAADDARATVLRDGTFTGFTRHTCSQ